MIIDTHTHLYLDEFSPDKDLAVKRALDAGVKLMIFPNVDISTIAPMRLLASHFPDNIYMGMGLHPTEINDNYLENLAIIDEHHKSFPKDYIAIGEIGMDLYWDKTYCTQQMKAFDMQIDRAIELDLPVIIHCREALDQTLEVMKCKTGLRGVFHSFGGTIEDVDRIRQNHDFYFGINGIVTFKNCGLRNVLPAIGADRLLLETDSPYLAPVPHRGKRNESAYIVHTAAHIATSLDVSMEYICQKTTDNAMNLFGIGDHHKSL